MSDNLYIDSHCHLYDTRGVPAGQVVDAARAAGVKVMVNVGCDGATTAAAIALAGTDDNIVATAGLHPHDAADGIDTILAYVDDPEVVAIGETGLDYFYDHSPRDVQREVFAAQIALAHDRRLPLVIHSRDAWEDTFDVLLGEGVPAQTIFHCFTGGPDEARRALDLGAFLSFSGIVTFPSATDVQAAARLCPSERMLVETDSPYLAPVPHRGTTNQPANVVHVAGFLAQLRGQAVDEVRRSTVAATLAAFPGVHPR
jgi:TatD DNase family protein